MALTPIDFPDDPQTGDSFTAGNGVTYTWYNNRWNGKVNDVILTVPPDEIELNMLQDVCDDVPADGDVLTWDGTEWCGKEGPVDGVSPVVTVGATNTLPAGSPANVTQAPTADGTELTFSIPKGDKGDPGTGIEFKGTIEGSGPPDFDGTDDGDMWVDADGNAWIWEGAWVDGGDFTGPPGTPGTQVSVGSTTTLDAGQPAAVTESVDGTNLQLNFFIPKGDKGDPGSVDNLPDGVVAETGHYENGDLKEGIKFGRGGGGDRYPIDFAVRTDVTFNGSVDFDSRGTVSGLELNTLDNVSTNNPQVGQVLKYAGNNFWSNADDTGSSSDVDLSDYTKRNTNEIITKEWQFQDRSIIAGIELINRTNPFNGAIIPAYIDFHDKTSWENDTDYEVRLQIDDIVYGDGTTRKMLDVIGQGIQVRSAPNLTYKTGGINLLPTGIDLWRDDAGDFAHIDFKLDESDLSTYECRFEMRDVEYLPGEKYKYLQVRGQGMQIREHPDETGTRRSGLVNILPVGIDLVRNYAHIDFKQDPSLTTYDSRILQNENKDFFLMTKGTMYLQDRSGSYPLSALSGGSGGGGGYPGAGYGLYYTNGSTLNVDTSVVLSENSANAEAKFRSLDAQYIYLNGLDIRAMMGLTDVDDASAFAVNARFDGTWADLVTAYNTNNGTNITLATSYNECSTILNWYGSHYEKGGKILLPSKKFTVRQPVRLKHSTILTGPTGAMGNEKPKFNVVGNGWKDKIVFACTASDDAADVVGDYKFQYLRFSGNNLGVNTIISLGQRNAKSGEAEDDTDSKVRYCNFEGFGGGKRKSYAIFYNGRNANIQNCSFSSSGGGTSDKYPVCIGLDFTNIENDGSNKPDSNPASSNRKNRVRFNSFHVGGSATAIEVTGDYPSMGLLISNNTCDTGARLLDVLSGGLSGAAITANTYWKGGSSRKGIGVINIRKATGKDTIIESCTISGNGFSCLDEALGNQAKDVRLNAIINVESGVKNRGLAITGNTLCFAKDGNYAVQIDAGAEYTTVTGNVIRNSQNNRCGDNGVSPGVVKGFNVGNN